MEICPKIFIIHKYERTWTPFKVLPKNFPTDISPRMSVTAVEEKPQAEENTSGDKDPYDDPAEEVDIEMSNAGDRTPSPQTTGIASPTSRTPTPPLANQSPPATPRAATRSPSVGTPTRTPSPPTPTPTPSVGTPTRTPLRGTPTPTPPPLSPIYSPAQLDSFPAGGSPPPNRQHMPSPGVNSGANQHTTQQSPQPPTDSVRRSSSSLSGDDDIPSVPQDSSADMFVKHAFVGEAYEALRSNTFSAGDVFSQKPKAKG